MKIIYNLDDKFIKSKVKMISKLYFTKHERPTIFGLDGFAFEVNPS